ncbi:MAG: hypothetical protein J0H20_19635, partial [Rhizobiales bacterium]|nr:hypothetical protein [Hyphomicrobiales bacterium]
PGLPNGVYFAAALVVGLGMPILLHRLLVRTRWTALLFLGITLRPVSGARADGADAKAEKAATT